MSLRYSIYKVQPLSSRCLAESFMILTLIEEFVKHFFATLSFFFSFLSDVHLIYYFYPLFSFFHTLSAGNTMPLPRTGPRASHLCGILPEKVLRPMQRTRCGPPGAPGRAAASSSGKSPAPVPPQPDFPAAGRNPSRKYYGSKAKTHSPRPTRHPLYAVNSHFHISFRTDIKHICHGIRINGNRTVHCILF